MQWHGTCALRLLSLKQRALHGGATTPSYRFFARCLTWGSDAGAGATQRGHDGAGDTIFALSSGQGRSAVAVIRLSGPGSDAALAALLPLRGALPAPRCLTLSTLRHPHSREVLDMAMVVRFPAPHSFTGEDCSELHVHGGPAVVRSVLDALHMLPWARPAQAGEFSRRAFECGRLDLTEVEGLADLLRAETEWQRRTALAHSSGAARRQYEAWRGTLLTCLARVEAVIDFGEDEGIADDVAAGVVPLVLQLKTELERHLAAGEAGELVREGVRVAILGPPNAGKSSLLNTLAGRDAAIVSPIPGTTRDTLEVALDLGGYKVIVTDSAGLRETEDPVEAEGVKRAQRAAWEAHILLILQDATQAAAAVAGEEMGEQQQPQQGDEGGMGGHIAAVGVESWPAGAAGQLLAERGGAVVLPVLTKMDLLEGQCAAHAQLASYVQAGAWAQSLLGSAWPWAGWGSAAGQGETAPAAQPHQQQGAEQQAQPGSGWEPQHPPPPYSAISCATGAGLDALLARLQGAVRAVVGRGGDPAAAALVARSRHRHHICECVAALQRYQDAPMQVEIAAEELRAAAKALGRVTGAIDTESVLDSVFAEFCIGK